MKRLVSLTYCLLLHTMAGFAFDIEDKLKPGARMDLRLEVAAKSDPATFIGLDNKERSQDLCC